MTSHASARMPAETRSRRTGHALLDVRVEKGGATQHDRGHPSMTMDPGAVAPSSTLHPNA